MERLLVYHSPSCSKSRGALEILADEGVDHDVVEYLRAPPDRVALERIVDTVDVPPAELIRRGDGGFADRCRRAGACDGDKGEDRRFEELGLSASGYTTRDAGGELLLRDPQLVQRAGIFPGGRAPI